MIVSDYDGTLFNGKQSLFDNIETIEKFRSLNNLFVIATERNFSCIKKEIDFYKIPYDYLICDNGSVVIDSLKNTLAEEIIEENLVKSILKYLNDNIANKPILYDAFGKTYSTKKVVSISVTIDSCTRLKEIRNFLKESYDDIQIDKYHNQIFIRKKYFKDYGIDCIYSNLNQKPDMIYTIGNDKSDIEMLKRFKGYLIYNAYLRDASIKKCNSVKQLIKKIM